jgi:hypothetical protein
MLFQDLPNIGFNPDDGVKIGIYYQLTIINSIKILIHKTHFEANYFLTDG